MYTLAAIVGERITGRYWQTNIADFIFNPLGMNDSRVGYTEMEKTNNYAKSYGVHNDKPRSVTPDIMIGRGPASEVASTAIDMSHWMIAWLNGGRFKNEQVLPQHYIQNATSKYQLLPSPPNRPEAEPGYGYGWLFQAHER